jgi:hypothetical protein
VSTRKADRYLALFPGPIYLQGSIVGPLLLSVVVAVFSANWLRAYFTDENVGIMVVVNLLMIGAWLSLAVNGLPVLTMTDDYIELAYRFAVRRIYWRDVTAITLVKGRSGRLTISSKLDKRTMSLVRFGLSLTNLADLVTRWHDNAASLGDRGGVTYFSSTSTTGVPVAMRRINTSILLVMIAIFLTPNFFVLLDLCRVEMRRVEGVIVGETAGRTSGRGAHDYCTITVSGNGIVNSMTRNERCSNYPWSAGDRLSIGYKLGQVTGHIYVINSSVRAVGATQSLSRPIGEIIPPSAVSPRFVTPSTAPAPPIQKGADALQRGDYAAALRILGPLAEAGDRIAETDLGWMYDNGDGVALDSSQAID